MKIIINTQGKFVEVLQYSDIKLDDSEFEEFLRVARLLPWQFRIKQYRRINIKLSNGTEVSCSPGYFHSNSVLNSSIYRIILKINHLKKNDLN